MYAKIVYNADVAHTATLILEHITQLFTGETVVANLLGGDIEAADSTIDVSFEAVAYNLYHDISATRKVFEIPIHDDPTSYFYLELIVSGVDIDMKLWETWTIGTTSGSGGAYYTTTGFEIADVTGYTTTQKAITITATATHCIVKSADYFRGWMQYERGEAWDTIANSSKPVVLTYNDTLFIATAAQAYGLPHKRSDGLEYSGSGASLWPHIRAGNCQKDALFNLVGNSAATARTLDENEQSVHPMWEFGFSSLNTTNWFITGVVPNMYWTTYGHGIHGDTVMLDGNLYMIWQPNLNGRIAIRMG